MTETQWLECSEPTLMMQFLTDEGNAIFPAFRRLLGILPPPRLTVRKTRLFAVACCLRIADLIPTEASKECALTAERFADGSATDNELARSVQASMRACAQERECRRQARPWSLADAQAINAVSRVHRDNGAGTDGAAAAARAWDVCIRKAQAGESGYAVQLPDFSLQLQEETFTLEWTRERAQQAEILRDLVGPLPFRQVDVEGRLLAWNNGAVRSLAQAIYNERAFDRMPILADAIEDAGCHNEDILSHCRQQTTIHARGCWVIDVLLCKE